MGLWEEPFSKQVSSLNFCLNFKFLVSEKVYHDPTKEDNVGIMGRAVSLKHELIVLCF